MIMETRGFEILMTKLSYLQETAQKEGLEGDIEAYSDRWPQLKLYVRPENGDETDSDMVAITCLPDGSDEFRFFLISAECELDVTGRSPGFVQLACNVFNGQTTGGFAYPVEGEGIVMYRAALPEADIPVSGEVFGLFLRLFTGHLKKIKELLPMEEDTNPTAADTENPDTRK